MIRARFFGAGAGMHDFSCIFPGAGALFQGLNTGGEHAEQDHSQTTHEHQADDGG